MKSPLTTIFGALTAVATILQQAFHEQGIPQTPQEWFVLAMGLMTSLGLYFAKDFNVTGTTPKPEDTNVKPILSALLILGITSTLTACAQYKSLKDSFCSSTTLCEVIKEVKDAAKEEAKDAAREAIKDALTKEKP